MSRRDHRDEGAAEVAGDAVLRRVEGFAYAWSSVAALGFAAGGRWWGVVVLTAAAAASILGFRSLEGLVRRLDVDASGVITSGGGRRFVFRWLLLVAAFGLAVTLGARDALALLVGVSVVPMAMITEAGIQLLGVRSNRDG